MHWIDPASLPEIKGRVQRFLVNPHGDADGLIFTNGTEVHFPPHLGAELAPAILKAGDAEIRVRGVRPRTGDVFAAVAFELPDGVRIEDHGPDKHEDGEKKPKPPHEEEHKPRILAGRVARPLHGPKGERRGLLLESGEIVRFPPHAVTAAQFEKGADVAARGKSRKTEHGEVLEAKELGPDVERLRPIEDKKPKQPHHDKPKKPKH